MSSTQLPLNKMKNREIDMWSFIQFKKHFEKIVKDVVGLVQ